MKNIRILTVFTLLMVSCGHEEKIPSRPLGSSSIESSPITSEAFDEDELWRYHLKSGCDSEEHVFRDENQFCQSLQVRENNANCPEDLRKDEFQKLCPQSQWNPDKEREKLLYGQGPLLHCVLDKISQYSRTGEIFLFSHDKLFHVQLTESQLTIQGFKSHKKIWEKSEDLKNKVQQDFLIPIPGGKQDVLSCRFHSGPLR